MIDFTKLQTAEQKAQEAAKQATQARITELTQLLSGSDYKVLPDYDKANENITEQRQSWREEIRTLEAA
jgi:hypothetical protein